MSESFGSYDLVDEDPKAALLARIFELLSEKYSADEARSRFAHIISLKEQLVDDKLMNFYSLSAEITEVHRKKYEQTALFHFFVGSGVPDPSSVNKLDVDSDVGMTILDLVELVELVVEGEDV